MGWECTSLVSLKFSRSVPTRFRQKISRSFHLQLQTPQARAGLELSPFWVICTA